MQSSAWRCSLAQLVLPRRFPLSARFVIECVLFASAFQIAAATGGISVQVDPGAGDDSRCATTFICRTIAYAVQRVGASHVNLSAGVFNESTVSINNVTSLVVIGVPSSTFFDCSRRAIQSSGPAFNINNSTVKVSGVTFQHCSNLNGSGGALSAIESNVDVSECRFTGCSAANGGAISATGLGSALFLIVQNSTFSRNSAIGALVGCHNQSGAPCSTWGGAIAAFEIVNVSVSGCSMTENTAVAVVPMGSSQIASTRNAVAGGGCLSVLFLGNFSAFSLHISGNLFERCVVDVSSSRNIVVGNGNICFWKASIWFAFFACSNLTDSQDTVVQYPFILACLRDYGCSMSHFAASPSRTTRLLIAS